MDPALLYVSYIGILLLIGLLFSIISRKLKIPNMLFLILIGMVLGLIRYKGAPIVEFSPIFLTAIAIFTLATVVFDSSSKFKFWEFDSMSASALKLSIVFLVLNMIFLSAATYYLFKPGNIFLALIFAAMVSGTDPSSTLMILSGARSKLFGLLKVESILNTPLIVLIPFLLVDLLKNFEQPAISTLQSQIIPFAQQFVTGIGTGVLLAIIFFRFMKKFYSPTLSPLAILTASLLAYIIAENLGGNGVLSVTTAGIMFGNVYRIKHLHILQKFEEVFSEMLEILVFILVGSIINIPWTLSFLLPATLIFLISLIVRFLSVQLLFRKSIYSLKEKIYMTFNIPKGIAVAVVVFSLATKSIAGIKPILDLTLLFVIYSIVLSTIVTRFSKFFTKIDIKITEKE